MKIVLIIAIGLALAFCVHFFKALVLAYGKRRGVSQYRIKYIMKTINIGLIVFFSILLINVSGFEYGQVSLFLSSLFAILGVALFAQWSILSNITASLIIFFGFPYRVGDTIRVIDPDDEISGVIEEITLFHVLMDRDGELLTYPNTLILQKAVILVPNKTKADQTLDAISNE